MDYNKYKLTVFKGMTVPVGYTNGSLTPYEAVAYLQKLGLDEDLYEDVIKSIQVQVPSGYVVTSPEGTVTEAGKWVNTTEDDKTWDQFEQNAPNRGWTIEYDESLEYDDSGEGPSSIQPEGDFESLLAQTLGTKYTMADIRTVAEYYNAVLETYREQASGDPETLKRIDESEAVVIDGLNELVASYLTRKLAENGLPTRETASEETAKKAKAVVDEFGDYTISIPRGAEYNSRMASIKISLREIKGSKVKEGRSDLNLGSFLASLTYANTPESLAIADELIEKARLHREYQAGESKAGQAPTATIKVAKLFKTLTPGKAYDFMISALNPANISEDEAGKLRTAAELSTYMMPPTADTLAEQRKIVSDTETMWKIERNLRAAMSGSSSEEYKEAAMELEALVKAREFMDGALDGSAAVSVLIDLATIGYSEPQVGVIRTIFESLDAVLTVGRGDLSFVKTLDDLIRPDMKGEELESAISTMRVVLTKAIKDNPLITKNAVQAQEIKTLHKNIAAALELDGESLIYQTILTLSGTGENDKSPRKVIGDFKKQHPDLNGDTWDFTSDRGPRLAKGLSDLVKKHGKPGMGGSQVLADPNISDSILREVKKLGYNSEELEHQIVSAIQSRAKTGSELIDSAFGSSLTQTELREAAKRGALALLVTGLQSRVRGQSEKYDTSGTMARLVTRVLNGQFDGYDTTIGSFFAGKSAVFAEILTRFRVLPSLDSEDNISWGGNTGFRNAILNDYLRTHPEAVGTLITDIDLVKHASFTQTEVPAVYLLTGNVHNNAEYLRSSNGEPFFGTQEEISAFKAGVSSVDISDPNDRTGAIEVADTVRSIDRITTSLIGTKRVNRAFEESIEGEGFNPKSFEGISLSSAANYLTRNKDRLMQNGTRDIVFKNITALVGERVSQYTDNPEVMNYVMEQLDSAKKRGGTTGHSFEIISGLPSLMHHIKNSGMVEVARTAEGSGVEGLSWTGTDGKSHTFGKLSGATGGTVDFVKVTETENALEIHPVEGKMEYSGGSIPHHGNPEHFSRSVAELWKKHGKNVKIYPPIVTNAPHSQEGATGSGIHSLSMDFTASDIQTIGRTFHKGSLLNGDEIMRSV